MSRNISSHELVPKRILVLTLASLALLALTARGSQALYPGDCGKPTAAGTLSSSKGPVATDALYILGASVGTKPCDKRICDVDNSGAVAATDGLITLKKAVGISVTLSCLTSAKNCTKTKIKNLLDDDPSGFDMATDYVAGLVHCTSPTTRKFSDTEWSSARRTITADDVWFHGRNITIELDPPCYQGVSGCPNQETGPNFMTISGDNVGVSGFTVTGFVDGVLFNAENGTVGNMLFDYQCDDSITAANSNNMGAVVRDTNIINGCDKCVQIHEGAATTYNPGASPRPSQCSLPSNASGTPPNRECYHISIIDTDFQGCEKPMKVSSGSSQGNNARFYVQNVEVTENAGDDQTGVTGENACQGTSSEGDDVVGDFVAYISDGCDIGLFLAGENSKYTVDGESHIHRSDKRGVISDATGASAEFEMRNSIVSNNGGWRTTSAEPIAGLGINTSAIADFGTDNSSDKGNNKICCNKVKLSGSVSDRDVHNKSTGTRYARGNYWCSSDGPDVLDEGSGSDTKTDQQLSTDPHSHISNTCSARTY